MIPPDARGTVHHPAHAQARIVSLVPSITELLFDLGLGAQVVGRTTFCIHPAPQIDAVTRVGGTKTVRFDRLAALKPSHVIVNIDENLRADAERLREMGLEVIVTHPIAPQDNPGLYRLLGALFSCEAQANALCDAFTAAHAALEARASAWPRQRVLYLIWRDPWMSVSRDTYVARVLAGAGLDVVALPDPARYPQLRIDDALLRSVDQVLLSSEPYPFKAAHQRELHAVLADDGPAVRFIDGEMTSWYGSRAIRACDYLARFRAAEQPPQARTGAAPASNAHARAPYTRDS